MRKGHNIPPWHVQRFQRGPFKSIFIILNALQQLGLVKNYKTGNIFKTKILEINLLPSIFWLTMLYFIWELLFKSFSLQFSSWTINEIVGSIVWIVTNKNTVCKNNKLFGTFWGRQSQVTSSYKSFVNSSGVEVSNSYDLGNMCHYLEMFCMHLTILRQNAEAMLCLECAGYFQQNNTRNQTWFQWWQYLLSSVFEICVTSFPISKLRHN